MCSLQGRCLICGQTWQVAWHDAQQRTGRCLSPAPCMQPGCNTACNSTAERGYSTATWSCASADVHADACAPSLRLQIIQLTAGGVPWKEHLYELEKQEGIEGDIKFCLYEVAP